MVCTRCAEHPNFHSFKKIGQTQLGHAIYFSKPYLAIEKEFLEASVPNYLAHMDEATAQGTWIYIFDAEDLDRLHMPNVKVIRRFYKTIEQRYKDSLMKIIILHLNWKTKLLLNLVLPFVSEANKARLCLEPTPLELVHEGVPTEIIRTLYAATPAPPATPAPADR